MKWRRYKTEDGASWTTYEVPAPLIKRFTMSRLSIELERMERRKVMLNRQARLLKLLAAGWKVSAAAHELGLSDSQAYRIRAAGKPGAPTYQKRPKHGKS